MPTTLTKVTAKPLGLVTFRVTSPEPPGSSGVVGLTVVDEMVTVCMDPTLAEPVPRPELVKYA